MRWYAEVIGFKKYKFTSLPDNIRADFPRVESGVLVKIWFSVSAIPLFSKAYISFEVLFVKNVFGV